MYTITIILSIAFGIAAIFAFRDGEFNTGLAFVALSLLLGIKADCINLYSKIDAVNSTVAEISAPAEPAADPEADTQK